MCRRCSLLSRTWTFWNNESLTSWDMAAIDGEFISQYSSSSKRPRSVCSRVLLAAEQKPVYMPVLYSNFLITVARNTCTSLRGASINSRPWSKCRSQQTRTPFSLVDLRWNNSRNSCSRLGIVVVVSRVLGDVDIVAAAEVPASAA